MTEHGVWKLAKLVKNLDGILREHIEATALRSHSQPTKYHCNESWTFKSAHCSEGTQVQGRNEMQHCFTQNYRRNVHSMQARGFQGNIVSDLTSVLI